MNGQEQWRHALGEFLRTRRLQVVRADLGLPRLGGRSMGLRREELSYLSSVSVTWYTWLEQGREIKPSRQVLDALARTLRLSVAEHSYVLSLAGYSAPQPADAPQVIPAHVQRLLDAFGGLPAYALAPDFGIPAWTCAFEAVYPNVATVAEADRNLLWLMFTDPYLRDLMPDWEVISHRLLATFRAEAGLRLGEPHFSRLVERLLGASESFRAGWESHDIDGFITAQRLLCHPIVGELHLEQHRLSFSDHPALHVVICTPVATTDTPARLRKLVGDKALRLLSPG
ncbi:helix-turn-helix transcriptional regulator [Pseudonocardia sp.]|uniref:helix-turn-helix transcriptional regulator n=1 Tax=Pseudonocardia sp. TaxID=60912 RepID=UPI0031FBDFCF